MPKKATTTFPGFEKDATQFWHELAAEMNKEWFAENKERYQRQWVEPMTALLGDVSARLAKTYKPRVLSPPKIMRIHRDVRFAKDKSPYKTHIGASLHVGGADDYNVALYIHMGIDEEFVGVGCYMFDDKKLPKWRKLVAGKDGAALVKLVDKLRAKGYQIGGHDNLKRVPKPYDADHERAEYLKMKGLTGVFPAIPKGMVHEAGLVDWLVEHATATAPLVSWLYDHV